MGSIRGLQSELPDSLTATSGSVLPTARWDHVPLDEFTGVSRPEKVPSWDSEALEKVLYRDAALADGTGPDLRLGVSLLVEQNRIVWIRPVEDEPDPGPETDVVDASRCTIVPGLVDSHSHLTLPGGAHWIDRGFDPTERLLEVAEHNAGCCGQQGCVGSEMSDRRRGPTPSTDEPGRWHWVCAIGGQDTASNRTFVPRAPG
jgi:hypothetical protein